MRLINSVTIELVEQSGEIRISYVCISSNDKDTVRDYKWVPPAFLKYHSFPLGLDTFGSAWVQYSALFGYRYGPTVDPNQGIGSIRIGIKGETCLIMWPMQDTLKAGSCIRECTEMLAAITTSKAKAVIRNAVWCSLKVKRFLG